MLLPQPWRQFCDPCGRMLADPLQYVDQIGVGIDRSVAGETSALLAWATTTAARHLVSPKNSRK